MNPIDVDTLLEKNPQVDKDVIRERLEKVRRDGPNRPKRQAGSTSPYAGRRMVVDERSELDEDASTLHRSSYGRI